MKIGVAKEIKESENRVAITRGGVQEVVSNGHTVYIQHNAGGASGYDDETSIGAGATTIQTLEEVHAPADLVYKVKEPIKPEDDLIKPGQIIFAYFHLANEPELTEAMIRQKAICIAFETVRGPDDNCLPLLTSMSEVAGRMAAQEEARFLSPESRASTRPMF